jgi:predicted enzyme related to lactoylglutathione lyase
MPARLHSIAIFVTDIDRALEFYSGALGLTVHKRGSFGAELLEGDVHIGVHPAVHPDARAMVGRHTGITFHVENLLHVCGELHERGVRFVNEPTQMGFGIMAMVADPDGNIMALWEDKLPEEMPHTH